MLLKNCFRINCWLHYHVSSFSHLSCFDAFARTFINLWPLKKGYLRGSFLSEASEGEVPPSEAEKIAIFKLNLRNLVHTFCQHFTEKPIFIFDKILGIIMSIPPTFLVLMPLLELKPLTIEQMGVSEGELPFRSWEKCKFQTQFAKFGAYLLPTFYWKSIILSQWNIGYYTMSIPPTFPFFFHDKILAFMSFPPTFPVLMPLPELL